jgi:hypothetical protein
MIEICHPDEASIASGWKDLRQLRVSEAGSGFEIAKRSLLARAVGTVLRNLTPKPFPSGKGDRIKREMRCSSGQDDRKAPE